MAIDNTLGLELESNRADRIVLFWNPKPSTAIKTFKVYRDTVHTGTFATLVAQVPNVPNPTSRYLPGKVSVVLSRTAMSIASTDVAYFKITTVTLAGAESTKADSPVRIVFPVGLAPVEIAASDIPQTFSMGFTISSLFVRNGGPNVVLIEVGGQTIKVASAGAFDGRNIFADRLTVSCASGETATVQIAGGRIL